MIVLREFLNLKTDDKPTQRNHRRYLAIIKRKYFYFPDRFYYI